MGIRGQIKQILTRHCEKQYKKELGMRKITYQEWLAAREGGQPESDIQICAGEENEQEGHTVLRLLDQEIMLFQLDEGKLSRKAKEEVCKYFAEHPQVMIAYGDEDVQDSVTGERKNPWFKPDWSPDTFLSQVYYWGGVVAIRREWLEKLWLKERLLHVPVKEWKEAEKREILSALVTEAGGFQKGCNAIGHIPYILFHAKEKEQPISSFVYYLNKIEDDTVREDSPKVSVIIPSKDHPDILKQGLQALYATTDDLSYEILVVDNGSCEENRSRVERLLKEAPVTATYLYQPMEFDFSHMCNLGVQQAKGKFLLFLNDDVEMRCKGFMKRMVQKASKPYAGAVGMKLYYPDSVRMQHAGIVNLPMGPVHKLQFQEDTKDYYYGYNTVDRNVLAVTGACLMVDREKYREAGGMSRELPVAFNDVDLCFRLWELGYHNILLNSVHAWHHESLSRGDDESPQKLNRLLGEKEKLYTRHPQLAQGEDPYYSGHLNRDGLDTRIRPAYVTAGNCIQESVPVKKQILLDQYRRDNCLLFRVERCEEECIQGYGVVLGDHNACYDRELVLLRLAEADSWEPTGQITCFCVPLDGQYRPELVENMPDQSHVGLCGFWWKPDFGRLPAGNYRLGMTADSKIGKIKLINWSSHVLKIEGKVGENNEDHRI